MPICKDDLIPRSERWFLFTCAAGAFRVLVNRFKPLDAERHRKSYMREDKSDTGGTTERIDLPRWFRFLADEVLADWDGITETNGQPWPATPQNKLQMVSELGDLGRFLAERFVNEDAFRGKDDSAPDYSITGGQASSPQLLS